MRTAHALHDAEPGPPSHFREASRGSRHLSNQRRSPGVAQCRTATVSKRRCCTGRGNSVAQILAPVEVVPGLVGAREQEPFRDTDLEIPPRAAGDPSAFDNLPDSCLEHGQEGVELVVIEGILEQPEPSSRVIPANLCKVDLASYLDPVTDFERNPVENWSRPRKVLLTDGPLAATAGTPSCTSGFIKAAFERMDVEVEHLVLAAEQIGHCLGCLRAGLLDLA